MRSSLQVFVVALIAAALWLPACGDDWVECAGEDHRPTPPGDANACHDLAFLLVRNMECTAGLFDQNGFDGISSRNAELAYQYARADYASSAEMSACSDSLAEYEALVASPECAAPSTDCGPAAGADNLCHDYYHEMLQYQQRCMPELMAPEGMDSYDAKHDAFAARADYATADESSGTCGGAIDYYASQNAQGTCYR